MEENSKGNISDFSSMPYVILDKEGIIRESNRAGAILLGMEQNLLIGQSFKVFVVKSDVGKFYRYLDISMGRPCSTKLRLKKNGDKEIYVQLLSDRIQLDGSQASWTVMIDYTHMSDEEREPYLKLRLYTYV